MANIADKMLGYMATTAEQVFWETLGFASHGGAYEPTVPKITAEDKAAHVSRVEQLFRIISQ